MSKFIILGSLIMINNLYSSYFFYIILLFQLFILLNLIKSITHYKIIIPVSSCINFIYIIYSSIILRSITSSFTYYLLYGISYRLFIDYIIPLLSYSSCCGASGAVLDVLCLKVMINLY